jgi:hypothetical protein
MKPSEGTIMFAQNHDRRGSRNRTHSPPHCQGPRRYSAVVPAHILDEQGCLIDELIQFVFYTLGAHHLDLRVYEAN